MVEAALGILSNVAFYTPRRTRTAPRLDKAGTLFTQVAPDERPGGPREIVESGAVAVIVTLLTPKAVGVRGSRRYALLREVVEGAVNALRNLAYHADCIGAIARAGAIPAVTAMFPAPLPGGEAQQDAEEELPALRGNPTALAEASLGLLHNLTFATDPRIEMLQHRHMLDVLGALVLDGAAGRLGSLSIPSGLLREAVGCLRHLAQEPDLTEQILDNEVVLPLATLVQATPQRESAALEIAELSTACLRHLGSCGGADGERARAAIVAAGALDFFVDKVVLLAGQPNEPKATRLQRHALGVLAQLGSHPLTQTKIAETPDAFRLIASMFRGLVESLGMRETDRGEAEDFLQSTLLLTWKLCDDPANKSAVVNEKLVPELVGVMEATSLQDKSRSGAKEVLTHLMGDAVVNQGWLATTTTSQLGPSVAAQIDAAHGGELVLADQEGSPTEAARRAIAEERSRDLMPGAIVESSNAAVQDAALALQLERRSVLGNILAQPPVRELGEPSRRLVSFEEESDEDRRRRRKALLRRWWETVHDTVLEAWEARKRSTDPYEVGRPVQILHKGKTYLISSTLLPTTKWDVGFAVCFVLVMISTVAAAVILHNDYVVVDYQGTVDDTGAPIEPTVTTTKPLDVFTTTDHTNAWIFTMDGDMHGGLPVFVVMRSCVVGGGAALVWGVILTRFLALHADIAAPLGLVAACWRWFNKLSESEFSTGGTGESLRRGLQAFGGSSSGSAGADDAPPPVSGNATVGGAEAVYVVCGISTFIWMLLFMMGGIFGSEWHYGRKGRMLALAFWNAGRLVLMQGDPWLLIIVVLLVCLQVVWTVGWVVALSAVLSLDGEGREKLTTLRTLGGWMMALSFVWSVQVFQHILHVVGAACAASWYRTPPPPIGTRQLKCCCCGFIDARPAARRALRRACTVSIGSICVGSLLTAPVRFLRVALPQPPQLKYEGAPANASSLPLIGPKIPPGLAEKMDQLWDMLTAFYLASVMMSWHVLDGLSNAANPGVFAMLPAAGLVVSGPKVSGKYMQLASEAWRTSNESGLQPLRQAPLFYWLGLAACCTSGAVSAAYACTEIRGDFPCGTAKLAVWVAFVVGFVPMATLLGTVEGAVNALLTLFVTEQATMLQKDSRLYAAILVALEAAQASGHLSAVGTTVEAESPATRRAKAAEEGGDKPKDGGREGQKLEP